MIGARPLIVVAVALAGCASGSYVPGDQRAAQACYDHAPQGNGDRVVVIRDRETARLVAGISETRGDADAAAVVECIDRYLREKRARDVH
jgi:hypothetical protein